MHISAFKNIKVNKHYVFFSSKGHVLFGKVLQKILNNPFAPQHKQSFSLLIDAETDTGTKTVTLPPDMIYDFKLLV